MKPAEQLRHPVGHQPSERKFNICAYDPLLNSKQTREESGGVGDVTLWRWRKDAQVQFPAPDIVINGRNYWYRSTIRRWQAERAAKQTDHPSSATEPQLRQREG